MRQSSVAIVSPSFYPMIGGVEAYVLGIGRELAKLGHDVHVYTPNSVLGRKMELPAEEIDGIKVHRLSVPIDISYRLKIWPDLLGELMKSSLDIIHVYSHDSYAILALLAAKAIHVPIVLTTYGPFETHSDYGPLQGGLFRVYDAVVSPNLLRRCDLVMIRYPALNAWLRSMKLPDERIRLEPSGVPEECLQPRDGNGFRKRYDIEGPLIMYLGRLSEQKGVQHAVEAMKLICERYPTAQLVLIGPDYTGISTAILARSRALGIDNNLRLAPPMTTEESQMEALAACDVFIMPSSFEGFSQAVMKAMAQGKPVVVTNVGGLPYEVGYGSCGILCEYGDPEALAYSIMKLIENPALAEEMGNSGKARAQRFTFGKLAKNISDAYDGLTQGLIRWK
ncbi:MAG: glycosyltransferase family 4 protein [Thaumarchaeota archaeon]|nr:glycosyltransferase family 4 protein [Nitrososphaerota archaeon]